MDKIQTLQEMIDNSHNIVFFGGAGTSTDSGINDFRGKNGLYSKRVDSDETPEYMLSAECFYKETKKFYQFYKDNMNCLSAKPNIIHEYLKKLEEKGKLKAIITQNIDNLHQKAGCKNVYQLHGTIYKNHCLSCGKQYSADYVFKSNGIPKCTCGGTIKPDVVLYGEMLPDDFDKSQLLIYKADMLIVAGTSLTVEPASSLLNLFNGKYLVIINDTETPYDNKANLVINENLKEVFSKLHI